MRASVSTAAILSLSTGIAMVERFEGMHEAAEAIIGYPIFTHEFPALADRMRDLIIAQIPDFPTEATSENWADVRAVALARYGDTIEIEVGTDRRSADPLTTLDQAITKAKS